MDCWRDVLRFAIDSRESFCWKETYTNNDAIHIYGSTGGMLDRNDDCVSLRCTKAFLKLAETAG